VNRFERYVAALSDEDALTLHRIACRRAASIYGPLYRQKRDANWKTGMQASQSLRRAPRSTAARV
jgi:hypothetical protein